MQNYENGEFVSLITEKNEELLLSLSLEKSDFRVQDRQVGNFDNLEDLEEEEVFRGQVVEMVDSQLFEQKILE